MADAARDGEAQEGSSLPSNIYAFSFRTVRESCRPSCHHVKSRGEVLRTDIILHYFL